MPRHTIMWVDDSVIGYLCPTEKNPNRLAGTINTNGIVEKCEVCGMELRLIYDVRLEEVKE